MKIFIFITCLIAVSFTFSGATPPDAVTKAVKHQFPHATHVVWGKEHAKEWKLILFCKKQKCLPTFLPGAHGLKLQLKYCFHNFQKK